MALLALDARMRIQDFGQILLARFKHTRSARRERRLLIKRFRLEEPQSAVRSEIAAYRAE